MQEQWAELKLKQQTTWKMHFIAPHPCKAFSRAPLQTIFSQVLIRFVIKFVIIERNKFLSSASNTKSFQLFSGSRTTRHSWDYWEINIYTRKASSAISSSKASANLQSNVSASNNSCHPTLSTLPLLAFVHHPRKFPNICILRENLFSQTTAPIG